MLLDPLVAHQPGGDASPHGHHGRRILSRYDIKAYGAERMSSDRFQPFNCFLHFEQLTLASARCLLLLFLSLLLPPSCQHLLPLRLVRAATVLISLASTSLQSIRLARAQLCNKLFWRPIARIHLAVTTTSLCVLQHFAIRTDDLTHASLPILRLRMLTRRTILASSCSMASCTETARTLQFRLLRLGPHSKALMFPSTPTRKAPLTGTVHSYVAAPTGTVIY